MTHMIRERDYQATCKEIVDEVTTVGVSTASKEELMPKVEERLVNAAWVLRRLPDREKGFLNMRTMLWPESLAEPGTYPVLDMSSFEARRRVRISPQEIDNMQPALDLLQLLPDTVDRQLLFWACWHQEGEVQARVPWVKVRRSMGTTMSRWTLKRRYVDALLWLAALIALQT
ncbi:MAG: hypothetical protein AB3N28_11360 [Kordiimonas sp.]